MGCFRQRSWYLHVMIAVTAVVTPLCLGCRAWEPIIGCADESETQDGGMASISQPTPVQSASSATVSSGSLHQPGGVACGCGSCHGGTSPQVVVVSASATRPVTPLPRVMTPLLLALLPPVPPPPILL